MRSLNSKGPRVIWDLDQLWLVTYSFWRSTEHGTTNSRNLEVGVSHDQIPQKRLVFDEIR